MKYTFYSIIIILLTFALLWATGMVFRNIDIKINNYGSMDCNENILYVNWLVPKIGLGNGAIQINSSKFALNTSICESVKKYSMETEFGLFKNGQGVGIVDVEYLINYYYEKEGEPYTISVKYDKVGKITQKNVYRQLVRLTSR
jgi:hypothetical protein